MGKMNTHGELIFAVFAPKQQMNEVPLGDQSQIIFFLFKVKRRLILSFAEQRASTCICARSIAHTHTHTRRQTW